MKIKNKSKNKKIIIAAIVAVVVLVAGTFFWYFNNQDNKQEEPKTTEKNYVTKEDENISSTGELAIQTDESSTDEKIIRPGANNTSGTPEKPNITRAEQTGDFIRVSTFLNKPSNGKCILKLEKAGVPTVSKEAF